MNVKIDTKEKFTVIGLNDPDISANMTAEMGNLLSSFIKKTIPHLVLNMSQVKNISDDAAYSIATIQHEFYEKNFSFVICALTEPVEAVFERLELMEVINVTPTESEAWDIVQMEEIERELLGGFDEEE